MRKFHHQHNELHYAHGPGQSTEASEAFRQEAFEYPRHRRNDLWSRPRREEPSASLMMTGLRILSFAPTHNFHTSQTYQQYYSNQLYSLAENFVRSLVLSQYHLVANQQGYGFHYPGYPQSRHAGRMFNASAKSYSANPGSDPVSYTEPQAAYNESGAEYGDQQGKRAPWPVDVNHANQPVDNQEVKNDVRGDQRRANRCDDTSVSDVQHGIISKAVANIGRELWRDCCGTEAGRLGCAASVSAVLDMVGFSYAKSAAVGDARSQSGLVGQLMQHGWTLLPVSAGQPGDVIFGRYPGGQHGHVGIIGEKVCDKLTVYDNNSCTRKWGQRNLSDVFNCSNFGNQLYVLRAPEHGNH